MVGCRHLCMVIRTMVICFRSSTIPVAMGPQFTKNFRNSCKNSVSSFLS